MKRPVDGKRIETLFYRNKYLLVLSILAILVAGLSALVSMPRLEDPRIMNRNPLIITLLPGASATRVEALVTEKIEKALQEISELKEIRSTSRAGVSIVTVELQDNVDDNESGFAKSSQDVKRLIPELQREQDTFFPELQIVVRSFAQGPPVDAEIEFRIFGPAIELLLRRPDLRRAERRLAATPADIGAAQAGLFPRFFLTGSYGFDSTSLSDLFTWSSRTWSLGPTVRWPVFQGGRIRANIEATEARSDAAVALYEKTVISV